MRLVLALIVGALISCGVPSNPATAATDPLAEFLSTYHADVGSSVSLGDGRVLWLFGDTIRASGAWDRNSAVIQKGSTFTQLPGTFMRHPKAGHWYWPGQAVKEGLRLRVLAQDFVRTGPGAWDWKLDHVDVLSYSLPNLTLVSKNALPARANGTLWHSMRRTTYYTYVYGSYSVSGQTGKAYEVARVPNGKLAVPYYWKYLGTKMSPSMELGTVASVVRKATGGYRLYSKRLDMWGHEILSYDSTTPYGPWGNRRIVATVPVPSGQWTYAVEAHPEQTTDRLTLTYATNCDSLCDNYHLSVLTTTR